MKIVNTPFLYHHYFEMTKENIKSHSTQMQRKGILSTRKFKKVLYFLYPPIEFKMKFANLAKQSGKNKTISKTILP